MEPEEIKSQIWNKAEELGFSDMKIAKAEHMEEESLRLRKWLNKGFHGDMEYMENHFDLRVDPRKLVPGAQSIILFSYNYYSSISPPENSYRIAKYAYGKDYHQVLKSKLHTLFNYIHTELHPIEGRVFVDSAPVLERDWASRSGLGWTGKNTLIIHPKRGSYFFIGELIIDLALPTDEPLQDFCGTCRRCIDACPSQAISQHGYEMDGSKCISYATIEYKKDQQPEDTVDKLSNYIFGCDICQEVCPWNRFSEEHSEPEFTPHKKLLKMTNDDWHALTKEQFNNIFRNSAVKRTKFKGLKRNITWVKEEE